MISEEYLRYFGQSKTIGMENEPCTVDMRENQYHVQAKEKLLAAQDRKKTV